MSEQISQKFKELVELCKEQQKACKADRKLPRIAFIGMIGEFKDEGDKTVVEAGMALSGGHGDLHALVEHSSKESPDIQHFIGGKSKRPETFEDLFENIIHGRRR